MAVKKLLDNEVYPNLYFVGTDDVDTGEIVNYEISEFKDDREELYNFLTSYEGFLITFNGIHYDNVVNNYFVKCYNKLKKLSVVDFCAKIKEVSDSIIRDEQSQYRKFKNYNPIWIDVDLFLYWSKMLRISKKISLKSLAIQLNHEEIQELPYHPDTFLLPSEIEEIKYYNNVNDLQILRKLFNKQIEEVRLRRFIKYEYDFECWSFDAPKIASTLLLKEYCKVTGENEWEVKKYHFSEYHGTIGRLLIGIDFHFKNKQLKSIYEEILNSKRDFDKTFILRDGKTNLKVSLGIGGIHSLIENKKFKSNNERKIFSSDFASLYPSIIINYNLCRFKEVLEKYKAVKTERIIAKKEKQKQKDTLLKLVLNSFSGLIDNQYSWLYYPEGALKLRILGQLIELRVVDECLSNDIEVIALNTDSVDVLIEPERIEKYQEIIDNVATEYGLIFEHEEIEWTNYSHINGYIQKAKNGKIKRKGIFRYGEDIPLGDSVNEQVIPKALELYFDKKISVSESISNPAKYDFSIYDYCISKKIDKYKYQVIHDGEKIQNLNRYYFSKNAPYLFKKKNDKQTLEFVHVREGVKIFNKYEELYDFNEYEINYNYYIKKANDIIYALEKSEIQLSLF